MDDRERRRLARQNWPGRVLDANDEQASHCDLLGFTVAQRFLMVQALSNRAWFLSGKPWPNYTRADMPGRLIRPKDLLDVEALENE